MKKKQKRYSIPTNLASRELFTTHLTRVTSLKKLTKKSINNDDIKQMIQGFNRAELSKSCITALNIA